MDPGGDAPVPDRRNAVRRSGPSAPNSSNSRRKSTRLWSPPRVGGNSPSSPQRFWCRSMKASRSASGSVGVDEADLAERLGPPDLAADLVALLLAERREVAVDIDVRRGRSRPGTRPRARRSASSPSPSRARRTRPPARRRPGRRNAAGAGRRRPSRHCAELGDVRSDSTGDRRQVGGVGQDRRVVGVVRRPEEDRLRGRRDRGQRRSDPWRIVVWVSASVGSTSWRCISGTIAIGRRRSSRHRGRRRASARGRSRRTHPTTRGGKPMPRTASPTASRRESSQVARGMAVERSRFGVGRRRFGNGSGRGPRADPGQAGSASRAGAVIVPRIASVAGVVASATGCAAASRSSRRATDAAGSTPGAGDRR